MRNGTGSMLATTYDYTVVSPNVNHCRAVVLCFMMETRTRNPNYHDAQLAPTRGHDVMSALTQRINWFDK